MRTYEFIKNKPGSLWFFESRPTLGCYIFKNPLMRLGIDKFYHILDDSIIMGLGEVTVTRDVMLHKVLVLSDSGSGDVGWLTEATAADVGCEECHA